MIEGKIPRVRCEEHGVKQLPVNFAQRNSRFTIAFEQAVLVWLKDDSIQTVAENLSLSWDQVDGIMNRAVERGLKRRKKNTPEHIGIDETSFQKRHEYVTIILATENDAVIDVLDNRKEFLKLVRMNLKTARAWRIKEAASLLWDYMYMGVAKKRWQELLGWLSRCRLQPMIEVGNTVRNYLWRILNAIRLKVTNSVLEAKNTRIQRMKKIACDFRNRERFKTAILFHLGKLDCSPSPTR